MYRYEKEGTTTRKKGSQGKSLWKIVNEVDGKQGRQENQKRKIKL